MKPKGFMGRFNNLSSSRSTQDDESNDGGMNVNIKMSEGELPAKKSGGIFGFFKKTETESQPEETGPFSKFFECLPEEKSISNAFVAFGISGLLIFVSIFQIFSIITNPGKFVVIFTMAVIALLVGLA